MGGWVGGVRKLQFLLIYSTMCVGWPKSQKSKKTSWHNTWMGSPCSLCYILVRILKVSTSLGIKGQTIIFSRWHNRANKFNSTTCRLVFVRFLEESEGTKKTFRNQMTFSDTIVWKMGQQAWDISDVCFLSAHFTLLLLPLRWIKRRMIFWTMSTKEQATSTQINGLTTRPRRPYFGWIIF